MARATRVRRSFFFQRARYDEALARWEEALKITPDNVVVLRNLGGAYFSVGRYDEAASILQRALEVRPVAAIYTNLGTLRFYQGRYADAVAAFEKAVELGAGNHLYWGNLGDGYRWAPGRRNEAPAAFRRAIALIEERIATAGSSANLESQRAVYLVKLGNREEALKVVEGVTRQPNLSAQILFRLTMVFELGGVARTRAGVGRRGREGGLSGQGSHQRAGVHGATSRRALSTPHRHRRSRETSQLIQLTRARTSGAGSTGGGPIRPDATDAVRCEPRLLPPNPRPRLPW